jgi:two-component system, NtrC family, nitrogen regulation sensor histidine kinase NtrY
LMTAFNFPNTFFSTDLFDPQIFAVSSINSSLGDLFLNMLAVLVLCRYLFKYYFRFDWPLSKDKLLSWMVLIFSGLCILFAGLFPFVVIQTLYNNSSIVLDISQTLQFNGLRVIAILTVLISGVCAFMFSHVFIRVLASEKSRRRILIAFGIAVMIFVIINELTGQHYISSLFITLVYFSVVFFRRLYAHLKRLSYTTFAYLFIAIFCLAVNGAYCIHFFSNREKIENQFRFANNFLIDRDIFGEYLLHEASLKIANDALTQTRITSPFLGKEVIGQKIRQYFLPSYFNKYDVEIIIYNAAGDPVSNANAPTFSTLINKYNDDASRTDYEGIRFVSNPESDVTQKYLIVVPIHKLGSTAGYVVIELSLKKIIPENVYPELLVDSRAQQFYHTQDLNYAVFVNKRMLFTSGEFNYEKFFHPSWMGIIQLYTEGISRDGYDHIAQEDHNGRVAVVSTREASFTSRLANFSFLFVLGLLIILFLIFVQGVYNYFKGSRLFFSARIQLYLNLAFFIPLIIVSISTLSLTSRSSQQQLDNEYLNKAKTFGEKINVHLHDYFYGSSETSFNNQLTDLAGLSDLDANVYYANGTLLASSQPQIFENNLVSKYINTEAFNKIKSGENNFIESEKVGSLEYFIAYSSLKSPQTGELLGILGIPFFQSVHLLEKVQIVILINILNIFAFIFIALLVLSYFVSEWLTFPLKFITQSLRRTTLDRINSPLKWNASDEIGLMVKEYNTMLYKLSESKSELEQTQREKAWREIAQQVAHEIKNPLTPMKLTLQQLERSLSSGNGSEEKSKKAIETLLSQVDTLNEIASSFSGFAKMPELVIKKLDLITVLRHAVDLHSLSGEIIFRSNLKEALVMGDEQLLERTFSNLILNGLQAGQPGQHIRIEVSIEKLRDNYKIEVRDSGKGIDPKIADLVFLPHFSTKKSGSGLGLAIAKQGIEQMKGKIWFESRAGIGTSFFIELPVITN